MDTSKIIYCQSRNANFIDAYGSFIINVYCYRFVVYIFVSKWYSLRVSFWNTFLLRILKDMGVLASMIFCRIWMLILVCVQSYFMAYNIAGKSPLGHKSCYRLPLRTRLANPFAVSTHPIILAPVEFTTTSIVCERYGGMCPTSLHLYTNPRLILFELDFSLGNIKIYLHLLSFLNIEIKQEVESNGFPFDFRTEFSTTIDKLLYNTLQCIILQYILLPCKMVLT